MTDFIDTNVLVYAFGDEAKSLVARQLLVDANRIGVQSLNEFTVVLRSRMQLPWDAVNDALGFLRAVFGEPVPLTVPVHEHGLHIARRYGFQVYDSMLLAAALSAGCNTFWSEDLADGQLIEQRMTVRNPFTGIPPLPPTAATS